LTGDYKGRVSFLRVDADEPAWAVTLTQKRDKLYNWEFSVLGVAYAADGKRVFGAWGEAVVELDRQTGAGLRSNPLPPPVRAPPPGRAPPGAGRPPAGGVPPGVRRVRLPGGRLSPGPVRLPGEQAPRQVQPPVPEFSQRPARGQRGREAGAGLRLRRRRHVPD